MRKVLPLNTHVEIYCECWTHMRLAFILARKECFAWYCENFNNYYIENRFYSIEFSEAFATSYFDSYKAILWEKRFNIDAELENNIEDVIYNDGYIVLFCNYGCLFGEDTDTTNHEILIFGTDNIKKTFVTYLHYKNKWIIKEIERERVREAVTVAIKNQEDYFLRSIRFELPCIAYFFRTEIEERVNTRAMFYQFAKYLEGNCYKNWLCQSHQWTPANKQLEKYDIYFGIAVYDAYREGLYNSISGDAERIKDDLFRGIEHLLASKRELGRKIEFIRKIYGYTMDENFSTKEIVDRITIFRNLLMKYYYDNNLDNVKAAIKLLDELKCMDKVYYSTIMVFLRDVINKEIQ